MSRSPIPISRNDPSLAHAMSTRELTSIAARTERQVEALFECNTPKEFARVIQSTFGDSIIDTTITRARGTRASMSILVVDANSDNDFTLGIFRFNARLPAGTRVDFAVPRLVVRHHAVARAMQRTTGSSNIKLVVQLLSRHLKAALTWIVEQNSGLEREISIIGNGGALIGEIRLIDNEVGLDFATWVDGKTAADREIRDLAFSETISIRVR